ncbi:STAS domain-containing protein [Micromonospora sp. U21]|uniref:STAS domain-containing protein n=1 Tax=Micromonospora sp. U21 TaxID=2824899 RepID=UPI001B363E35|nr:STAS domain-containing protein [Micromonospora sp. U21]MBQ0907041.1 STAS domain-containing protein [Micromonospora sp. U21]
MTSFQPSWQHQVRVDPDHSTVLLSGEIDMNGAGQLLDLLDRTIQATRRVDVDMAAVQFIDSTGINALITARRAAAVAGGQLVVTNPSKNARRVLGITGVLEVLSPPGT